MHRVYRKAVDCCLYNKNLKLNEKKHQEKSYSSEVAVYERLN